MRDRTVETPRIGDRVLYDPGHPRPAGAPDVWDTRRTRESIVVHVGGRDPRGHGLQVASILLGDAKLDTWWAASGDLAVVGRASYADLRPLDADGTAGVVDALDGSTVALDFDGPIHSYRSGWQGFRPADPPTEGALDFVRMLLAAGANVVVHTSRADCDAGVQGVKRYLHEHGFPPLEVTYRKVPAAAYVDDRAVHFDTRKRWPYDDALLAEVVRLCRVRHTGEAHPTRRFSEDGLARQLEGEMLADVARRTADELIVDTNWLSEDFCGDGDAHGPHTWMPKPPRVGVSRDCPGTDTAGSASRQHHIDTGDYLPADERENR